MRGPLDRLVVAARATSAESLGIDARSWLKFTWWFPALRQDMFSIPYDGKKSKEFPRSTAKGIAEEKEPSIQHYTGLPVQPEL